MKIYTKTGDGGTTSLSDGTRVSKCDVLLEAYGTLDELNAFIGLLISEENDSFLTEIQNELFVLGGMLATPVADWGKYCNMSQLDEFTSRVEQEIDRLSAVLDPFKGFILPQGNTLIAHAHICRTICRRAEREVTLLLQQNQAYSGTQKLLNRLSDYFFILANFYHKKYNIPVMYYKSMK